MPDEELPDFLNDEVESPVEDRMLQMETKSYPTLPSGFYDATIIGAGAVPNPFFNPAEDADWKKDQMQFSLEIVHEGEVYNMRHWTSMAISSGGGKSKKSFLFALMEACGFDAVKGVHASAFTGKKVKFLLEKAKKADGTEYNKVVGGKYESI